MGVGADNSFRILITGELSGLVETITDAVSVHSIKKSEYARRLASGVPIGHVSLMDHFVNVSMGWGLLIPDVRQAGQWDIRQGEAELYQVSRWVQCYHVPPPDQGPPQRQHSRGP